jgi:hypothetical protein
MAGDGWQGEIEIPLIIAGLKMQHETRNDNLGVVFYAVHYVLCSPLTTLQLVPRNPNPAIYAIPSALCPMRYALCSKPHNPNPATRIFTTSDIASCRSAAHA